jgi:hypothetical protein
VGLACRQQELKTTEYSSEKAQIISIIWGQKLVTFLELQSEKNKMNLKQSGECTRHSGNKIVCGWKEEERKENRFSK